MKMKSKRKNSLYYPGLLAMLAKDLTEEKLKACAIKMIPHDEAMQIILGDKVVLEEDVLEESSEINEKEEENEEEDDE
jgi:hypothetical protein